MTLGLALPSDLAMFESLTPNRKARTISPSISVIAVAAIALFVVSFIVSAILTAPAGSIVIVGAILWIPIMVAAFALTKRITGEWLRVVARAIILAVFLTPSVVIGEGGVAPWPAVLVMFMPHEFSWGLVPLLVGLCVAFVIAGVIERFSRPTPQ